MPQKQNKILKRMTDLAQDVLATVWKPIVTSNDFYEECEHHGLLKRRFCPRLQAACCEKCSDNGIIIYRNMQNNVIRVSQPMYGHIQTYKSNGRFVMNIRPHKAMTSAHYPRFCRCGRGISLNASYCSIQCALAKLGMVPGPPAPLFYPTDKARPPVVFGTERKRGRPAQETPENPKPDTRRKKHPVQSPCF